MNIAIIGMRGCGKSNISRRLSVLSKRPVFSTDALISYEHQGQEIATILANHQGDWRVFRDLEYQVVKKCTALDGLILDTGGGVVVDLDKNGEEIYSERKVALLKQSGKVIWLRGEIATLLEKLTPSGHRPTLSSRQSDREIMERRQPFYQSAADWIVDIDGKSRKKIAKEIHHTLQSLPEWGP